jgi:hypothetical protein
VGHVRQPVRRHPDGRHTRRLALLVLVAVAALELAHPGVEQAAGDWWIAVHALLLLGYVGVAALLWRLTSSQYVHLALVAFGAVNGVYLAVDGVAVGWLARTDAAAAEQVWTSPGVAALANVTGALWTAALLLLADPRDRVGRLGALLTWFSFVASTLVAGAALVSRIVALATAGWSVYRRGAEAASLALLVFAAVLRQHVGPEAALGLLCVAIAINLR